MNATHDDRKYSYLPWHCFLHDTKLFLLVMPSLTSSLLYHKLSKYLSVKHIYAELSWPYISLVVLWCYSQYPHIVLFVYIESRQNSDLEIKNIFLFAIFSVFVTYVFVRYFLELIFIDYSKCVGLCNSSTY